MADINKLAPIIWKWEGGFANHPADTGGPTNMGVTLNTWKEMGHDVDKDGDIDIHDLRNITAADATKILRRTWDRWHADQIRSQSIANILVDWLWMSGKWGIIIPQRLLGVMPDGRVGPATIAAVNMSEPRMLHGRIWAERRLWIDTIIATDPAKTRFKQGWINRLNDFRYTF